MIVGIDFETYYSQAYSLTAKDLSMTEYIRSSEFLTHGISIKAESWTTTKWYEGPEVQSALDQFDWSQCTLMAHNAAFDGLIASHYYGIKPKAYICTLSMARPVVGHIVGVGLDNVSKYFGGEGKVEGSLLDVKGKRVLTKAEMAALGFYSCRDVDEMWMIYGKLRPWLSDQEMQLIDLTVRMYADPVLYVNQETAQRVLSEEKVSRETKLFHAQRLLGEEAQKILGSSLKFAKALKNLGIEPPIKTSPRTGKDILAFARSDLEFQELRDSENEDVAALVEARLAVKSTLGITRATRLISHSGSLPLPVALNYAKAHTFRWTGGDKMNLQNFKRKGRLRKSLTAPEGQCLVVVDSSQIEARKLLWLAEQWDCLDEFRTGDPYCILAEEVYQRPIDKELDPEERFVGKVGILGLGFGMAAPRYQHTLAAGIMGPPVKIELETARRVVETYRHKNKKVVVLWRLFNRILSIMLSGQSYQMKDGLLRFEKNKVWFRDGLTLHYPEMQYNEEGFSYQINPRGGRTKIYGAKFVENVVQFLARNVVAEQMLKISERYRIVMMTHDEVVFLVPESEAEEALAFGMEKFREAPSWCLDLPLDVEGAFGKEYMK